MVAWGFGRLGWVVFWLLQGERDGHADEVERFEREYVSLFTLAKQQGRHFRKVEIDAAGIKPALDPEKVGATFYRRSE